MLSVMGDLEDPRSGVIVPLPARCLVGRAPTCGLRLQEAHVSSEHAAIGWIGTAWELRDLGSRNGTYVDGQRLAAGSRCPLRAGARLGFGRPEPAWVLADDGPPDDAGAAEASATVGLEVGLELGRLTMRFEVSADEEHVALCLVQDGETTRLPARACNYVILTLARARLEDARAGRPEGEQGFRYADDLARQLGMEVERMNVDIFRARKQLQQARVQGAAGIVERRVTSHQLRIGVRRLEIASS
jgi:hypothetical protein